MRKMTAHKIRINRGGYDPTGYYFGTGAPVYKVEWYIEFAGMTLDGTEYVRATSTKDAKATILSYNQALRHNIKNSIGKL